MLHYLLDLTLSFCFGIQSKILVGTKHSEVLEVPERNVETLTVIYGHTEGELWGLACHPTSNICCTTSLDKTVKLWDINEKVNLKIFLLFLNTKVVSGITRKYTTKLKF